VGRKPSDDYDYGEPGKWGEDPELIDFVEDDGRDEDASDDRGFDEQDVG
jgi:hypothetical protein